MTEWDEFKAFDWETIYENKKPAFIFDGRNILNSINIKNMDLIHWTWKEINKKTF